MVTNTEVGQAMLARDFRKGMLRKSMAKDEESYILGYSHGIAAEARVNALVDAMDVFSDPNVDGPGMTDVQTAEVFEDILAMVEVTAATAGPLMAKAVAGRAAPGFAQRLWARAQVLPYSINVTFARMAIMLGQTDTAFVTEIRDWAIANKYEDVLRIVRLFRPDLLAKGLEAPPA